MPTPIEELLQILAQMPDWVILLIVNILYIGLCILVFWAINGLEYLVKLFKAKRKQQAIKHEQARVYNEVFQLQLEGLEARKALIRESFKFSQVGAEFCGNAYTDNHYEPDIINVEPCE